MAPPTPQSASWRERLGALASLGEDRRRALYLYVLSAPGPVGRDEAASAVGLSRGAAAAHLDRLVDDGVLAATFSKPAGAGGPGSGRPSKFYTAAMPEVAAAVPERSYELAGELLAAAAERSIATGEPMQECLRAVGRTAGEALGRSGGSLGDVLEEAGYVPLPGSDGSIELGNCPFHRLSRGHRGVVCGLNAAFLGGLLAGCGDGEHSIEPVEPGEPVAQGGAGDARGGGAACCARIVPRSA